MNVRESLLSKSFFYDALQKSLGESTFWKRYVNEFVAAKTGMKVLDIGCGTATILKYLPENLEYVGFDVNPNYIVKAQSRYGKQGRFFCQRVSDTVIKEREYFDIVLANAVLHHLDNDEATTLFQTAYLVLAPGGYLVTCDPAFVGPWTVRTITRQVFILGQAILPNNGEHNSA